MAPSEQVDVPLSSPTPGTLPTGSTHAVGDQLIEAGELVHDEQGKPVGWMAPSISRIQWTAALEAYGKTGLWPLLVDGADRGNLDRPWRSGELRGLTDKPADNAHELLPEWWTSWQASNLPDDEDDWYELPSAWPGPSVGTPGTRSVVFPGAVIDELFEDAHAVLLVPARRPADVIASIGWMGATNYLGPDDISTVLRRWEDLHGVVPLFLNLDIMWLHVGRPTDDPAELARIAAEHFSFCPDTIWQGDIENFPKYSASLAGATQWWFWWD